MKLQLTVLTILTGMLLINTVNAEEVCSRTGPITECGEGKLNQIDVAGKVTLHGTTVLGKTHVAGILKGTNASLNDLELAGKVKLLSSKVKGYVHISGLLIACNSNFTNKLNISSDHTHLENTAIPSIKISAGGREQVLYLANNTSVKGDVTFESGRGMVLMDDSSKISGKVKGGSINYSEIDSMC